MTAIKTLFQQKPMKECTIFQNQLQNLHVYKCRIAANSQSRLSFTKGHIFFFYLHKKVFKRVDKKTKQNKTKQQQQHTCSLATYRTCYSQNLHFYKNLSPLSVLESGAIVIHLN